MGRITTYLYIFIFLFPGASCWSQSNLSTGILPSLKASYALSERFRMMGGLEARNIMIQQWDDPDLNYSWRLVDVSGIISYRTSANTSLNAGYTARIVEGKMLNRFLQQFNVVMNRTALRIGHRFATDQTFGRDIPVDFRIRYRIAFEKPLTGAQTDPKEGYFKLENEYLWSYQDHRSDIEIRLSPVFGYILNVRNQIEFGIDYRYNEFVFTKPDHDFWIKLSWYGAFGSR